MQGPRAINRAECVNDPIDVARPLLRIAAVSFAAGFWGYLATLPLFGR
jgi:hypothetical protein